MFHLGLTLSSVTQGREIGDLDQLHQELLHAESLNTAGSAACSGGCGAYITLLTCQCSKNLFNVPNLVYLICQSDENSAYSNIMPYSKIINTSYTSELISYNHSFIHKDVFSH